MPVVGNLVVKIGGDLTGYAKAIQDVMARSQAMSQRLGQIGTTLTTGLTLPIVGAGTAAVKAASDVEEMRSKFNAVFKDLSSDVEQWAKQHADSIGRSRYDLMNYAADVQDTFVPLGFAREQAAEMSKAVVELAEDLASFKNLRTEEVVRGLTSALVGNVENLRQFGVVANEAQIKQKALQLGIIETTKEALTPQQKALAIWKLTLEGTTDAQGDAARTAESFANKMRDLQGKVKDLAVSFGQELLPTVSSAVDNIGSMVDKLNALDKDAVKTLTTMFVALAAAGPALTIASKFARFGGAGLAIGGYAAAEAGARTVDERPGAVGDVARWFTGGLGGLLEKWRREDNASQFNADFPVGPDANAFFSVMRRLAENAAKVQTTPTGPTGPASVQLQPVAGTLSSDVASGKALARSKQTEITDVTEATLTLIDLTTTLEEMQGRVAEATSARMEAARAGIVTVGEAIDSSLISGMVAFGQVGAEAFIEMITLSASLEDSLRSVANVFKSAASNILGVLATAGLATAITAIPGLGAASAFTKFGIPFFAEGGVVTRPTLAMIGEAGPEAVVPLRNAGAFAQVAVSGNLRVGIGELYVELEQYAKDKRHGPLGG